MENVSFVLEKEDKRDYHAKYDMVYAGTQKSDVEKIVKVNKGRYRLSIWLSGFLAKQYTYDGYVTYPKWELSKDFIDKEKDAIDALNKTIEEKRAKITTMEREAESRQKALDVKAADFAKVNF